VVLPLLWVGRITYRPAQPPEDDEMPDLWRATEPQAPLSWPVHACFIATETVCHAYATGYRQWGLVRTLPVVAIYGVTAQRMRAALERRRARQLGLTIETAPQLTVDCLGSLPPVLVWQAYLRLRGLKQTEPWPHVLAQNVIGEINRRRSWRHALTQPTQPAGPPQS
jgi:hypothetical protein